LAHKENSSPTAKVPHRSEFSTALSTIFQTVFLDSFAAGHETDPQLEEAQHIDLDSYWSKEET
jgi:hypothetical protein